MRDFDYTLASRLQDAFAADGVHTMAIAGGTEALNWFRLGVAAPERVIDLGRIPDLRNIRCEGDALLIGALATLNEVGENHDVRACAEALSQACMAAASPQIRNRATLGGNVLQKTRCAYFRAEAPLPWPCNKRAPGSGCAARHGLNERHAIFGWTDECVAVAPSDPHVALVALDAEIDLVGPDGARRISAADLLHTPSETHGDATRETQLRRGEMISGYRVPLVDGRRSAYVKVRERASFEYALVSAAAAITLVAGRIGAARVILGSVAMKPWRLADAEAALIGLAPTREDVLPVLQDCLRESRTLEHNAYKVAMAAGAAARAIVQAAALG